MDPMDSLSVALPWIDLLIHREVLRLRAQYQLSLDEFRGLYISDQQVDRLVNEVLAGQQIQDTIDQMTERAEWLRQSTRERRSCEPIWVKLRQTFQLSEFELDVLLLALAPHVHLKYETLFAYLNNDVTRKWLTCDLTLRLLSSTQAERMAKAERLLPHAPLMREGLLQTVAQTGERATWLSAGLTIAPGLATFLLGQGFHAPDLVSLIEVREPQTTWDDVPLEPQTLAECRRLGEYSARKGSSSKGPVIVVEGREDAGAGALAEDWCHELGIPTVVIDADRLRPVFDQMARIGRQIVLQQRLLGAGVVVYGLDASMDKDGHVSPEARRLLADLAEHRTLLVVALDPAMAFRDWLPNQDLWSVRLRDLGVAQRQKLWQRHLAEAGVTVPDADVGVLAERFILTGEQIRKAVVSTAVAKAIEADQGKCHEVRTLFKSACAQSGQALAQLAVKVNSVHTWDDLVLHPATMKRVKDVAAAITHRHVVYERWGFQRRLGTGMGLKVLFSGSSGTGKTMTASVIANDLGLDLYKIDLQGVVSKYIGETEKNLERIFRAAYCSNAILFFDEADALFGKRSEVKDAHDRYANIEVSYLLQKMEDFDGVVILASNWSKNIDDAFARRMQYVVDFPLPDEEQRARLWQGMLPVELPLGDDIDVGFLAKQFTVAGGDIKNVALDAAFLAAQNGHVVTMKQLIQAMARQQMKQGRILSVAEFKHHFSLIAQE
jgi:hypothetical protein